MLAKIILLVDDDVEVRGLVKRVLARHSYCVVEAGDGVEALALSRQMKTRIDMLLTDVVMPRMDGIELASRLCSMRPGLAVLCMSGTCEAEVVERDIQKKGFAFLAKPFRNGALAQTVAELLGPEASRDRAALSSD